MASSILDFQRYRALSELPKGRIDAYENKERGNILIKLEQNSRKVEDRLRHKYVIPFPERHSTIDGWIVALTDPWLLNQIGYDAQENDPLPDRIALLEKQANDELSDAADPMSNKWNLPRKDGKDPTGIVKGAPRASSERGPYPMIRRIGRAPQ
jgi:hypothetical protein